jgi:hypothetical protein
LTRLLCDAVEVRCDDGGCTVSMRAATPSALALVSA